MDTPEISRIESLPTDLTLSFLVFPEGLLPLLQYWGTFHSQIHSILEIVFPVWVVAIGVSPELDVPDDFRITRPCQRCCCFLLFCPEHPVSISQIQKVL